MFTYLCQRSMQLNRRDSRDSHLVCKHFCCRACTRVENRNVVLPDAIPLELRPSRRWHAIGFLLALRGSMQGRRLDSKTLLQYNNSSCMSAKVLKLLGLAVALHAACERGKHLLVRGCCFVWLHCCVWSVGTHHPRKPEHFSIHREILTIRLPFHVTKFQSSKYFCYNQLQLPLPRNFVIAQLNFTNKK